jgi:hypothetical protein
MASEPKRPDEPPGEQDNVVSLREARARQAAQAKKLNGSKPGGGVGGTGTTEKKMPVLLIFLGMLAVLVAYKFLVG